jgi:hypothetical protein
MNTYLAYILVDGEYRDEVTWAETEEQARVEVANWYPNSESITISQYEEAAE